MKITEHIKKANNKTLFSFEVIPPKKGNSIQELYDNIDALMEFNPPFIANTRFLINTVGGNRPSVRSRAGWKDTKRNGTRT